MRVAVVVSDFNAHVHIGAEVQVTHRAFDLPEEIAAYIRAKQGKFTTITLAVEDESKEQP